MLFRLIVFHRSSKTLFCIKCRIQYFKPTFETFKQRRRRANFLVKSYKQRLVASIRKQNVRFLELKQGRWKKLWGSVHVIFTISLYVLYTKTTLILIITADHFCCARESTMNLYTYINKYFPFMDNVYWFCWKEVKVSQSIQNKICSEHNIEGFTRGRERWQKYNFRALVLFFIFLTIVRLFSFAHKKIIHYYISATK